MPDTNPPRGCPYMRRSSRGTSARPRTAHLSRQTQPRRLTAQAEARHACCASPSPLPPPSPPLPALWARPCLWKVCVKLITGVDGGENLTLPLPSYLPSFLPSYLPAFPPACLPAFPPSCLPACPAYLLACLPVSLDLSLALLSVLCQEKLIEPGSLPFSHIRPSN